MLENILTHKDSTLTCVDAWDENLVWKPMWEAPQRFLDNLALSGFEDKVTIYKLASSLALRGVLRPKHRCRRFDFIYIDGNHNAPHPLEDAVLAFPLLKVGGILAFDDYTWNHVTNDTTINIDAWLAGYQSLITLLHKDYQVWVEKVKEISM